MESFADIRKLKKNYHSSFLPCLPGVCKQGGISVLLIQIDCSWCGLRFCICRPCWRGQAYCSDECRSAGGDLSHRDAQRRYRRTSKGRRAHREAERRRRMRISVKTVDDGTSTVHSTRYKMSSSYGRSPFRYFRRRVKIGESRCHFCGMHGTVVDRFPRRGYG